MKICQNCDTQNRDQAMFCSGCGTYLVVSPPKPPPVPPSRGITTAASPARQESLPQDSAPQPPPKRDSLPNAQDVVPPPPSERDSLSNARNPTPPPPPERTTGYDSLRDVRVRVASVLEDMSLLIGEPMQEVVTLQLGGMVVPGLGLTIDAANLAHRARDMQEGIFKVLVLGEFKNGKSTLLNAILGHKTLPAKATPTTAIITQLVYGKSQDVAIYEIGKENPRLVSRDSFVQEFKLSRQDIETIENQGYIDKFKNINYAKMECLHSFCENGVKLIDSPGLGEHVSRTKVTTNFLKQAQAIILVLNAIQILSEDERDFIEGLGQGRLNHVFFVVNRINQIDKDDDVEEIKNWTQDTLKPHFLDQNGQFDQAFYNRRVFFVNALSALEARKATPTDNAKLQASGVLHFERELEQFLTSGEKVIAILDSTIQVLSYIVSNARQKIANENSALELPLAELEKNRVETEKQLQELERNKANIEQTVLLFGEAIKHKIYVSLIDYLTEMQELWPLDSKEIINLDGALAFWKVIGIIFPNPAKNKIEKAIEREVKKYLQVKFGKWAERIPTLIDQESNELKLKIEAQVTEFQVKLEQIEAYFANGIVTIEPETRGHRTTRLAQILAGILLKDPSQVFGTVIGKGNWSSFAISILVDLIVVDSVTAFIGGPVGIAVWILAELVHIAMQKERYEELLLEKIGTELHQRLKQEMPNKQNEIYQKVTQQFSELATLLTTALQEQINEVRAEQDRIIRLKKDKNFSVEQEKQRLNTIGEKLVEFFNTVNEKASGKHLTPPEIDRLAKGKSTLLGQNR